MKWARAEHHIISLEQLEPYVHELATAYLRERLADGKSPSTLQAERAALRLFFDDRHLAEGVTLPRRARAGITRSRGTKGHDRYFQPKNWPDLMQFAQATGLHRHELVQLRVEDIHRDHAGQAWVHGQSGKGGLTREVSVLAGHEAAVLDLVTERDPEVRVFGHIPKHMDVHAYRRAYAQALYLQYASGRELPPVTGRIRPANYDHAAVERVSWALGHRRLDVVLRHYLRWGCHLIEEETGKLAQRR